jgi:phage shock protein E
MYASMRKELSMNWLSSSLPLESQMAPFEPAYHPPHEEPAQAVLPAQALLIDVRSYAEYVGGHLAGAHCLPLPQLEQLVGRLATDHDAPIILYCSSGGRAEQALGHMLHLGYSNVHNGGAVLALGKQLARPIEH